MQATHRGAAALQPSVLRVTGKSCTKLNAVMVANLNDDSGSPDAGHTGGAVLFCSAPRIPAWGLHSAEDAGGLQK
jgi:hypothetical protein